MEQITLYGKKSVLLHIENMVRKAYSLARVHKYVPIGCSEGMCKDLKKQGLTK